MGRDSEIRITSFPSKMFYVPVSWRALKHMLLKKEWLFINSSLMVRFAQRDYTISRTLTIITEGLKGGYNVLMELQLNI